MRTQKLRSSRTVVQRKGCPESITAELSDRDTSLFDFFLAEVNVKSSTIYWSRNNDSAQVTRVPNFP
jgi:hypothetical protein